MASLQAPLEKEKPQVIALVETYIGGGESNKSTSIWPL